MGKATTTDTQSPARHVADSHDLIHVHGARGHNLKDVSVVIPKRRLTVFTVVSGSSKSSLVFDTIAAESQRMINETYSAFVQGFMPTLARPEVDVLEGLTTAIIVDQERMGANARSTVGTATDANAMLRILFSRLGKPHIGSPQAYSFNVASISGAGAVTRQRGGTTTKERRSFTITGGMCPRCEGRGAVNDIDLTALYDDSKSLNEGAITVPGYSMDGWYGRIYRGCGLFDPDKPIRKYTKTELHDLLHREPTKVKAEGINLTYTGLIPQIQKSFLSKDVEAMQPHIRAFVERAVTFTTCPECDGTRLSEAARSSKIKKLNIADVCALQITDLAEWLRGLDEPSVAPLAAGAGVVSIDQGAIRGSRRSNPATYTGLLDPIRKAFAKANGVKPVLFSANSKGACPNCNGAGVIYTDLAMMAGVATTCEECEGKRFQASVLEYHLGGRDLSEVLAMSVIEAEEFFGAGEARTPAAHAILGRLADVGLGYLGLGAGHDGGRIVFEGTPADLTDHTLSTAKRHHTRPDLRCKVGRFPLHSLGLPHGAAGCPGGSCSKIPSLQPGNRWQICHRFRVGRRTTADDCSSADAPGHLSDRFVSKHLRPSLRRGPLRVRGVWWCGCRWRHRATRSVTLCHLPSVSTRRSLRPLVQICTKRPPVGCRTTSLQKCKRPSLGSLCPHTLWQICHRVRRPSVPA